MSLLRTLAPGVIGGMGLAAGRFINDLAAFGEVDEWAEGIAAADRHHLLNGQLLPPMEEPPNPPTPQLSTSKMWLWLPLIVWLVPAGLVGLMAFIVGQANADPDAPLAGVALGVFAAFICSAVFIPIGAFVGFLALTVRKRRNDRTRVIYEAGRLYWEVWKAREIARSELAKGIKPTQYLEAIGVDPQRI